MSFDIRLAQAEAAVVALCRAETWNDIHAIERALPQHLRDLVKEAS